MQLFVCDIDGCLAEPYRPFDLSGLQELAALAAASAEAPRRPALSLCSGRAYSYVEAMSQALDLTTPVLFESGGGLFDPVEARITWHPDFTQAVSEELAVVRQWMSRELVPGTAMSLDHGKRTQVGVVGPEEQEILEALPVVRRFVERRAPGLRVFVTEVSIDVVPPSIIKKHGLRWLAGRLGVALSEVAYIGDSEGDIEALKAVGLPLAPANANEAVRQAVRSAGGYVTDGRVIRGTLQAYRHCLRLSDVNPLKEGGAVRRENASAA